MPAEFTSTNPATGEKLKSFPELSPRQLDQKLNRAQRAFADWRNTTFDERKRLMKKLAVLLRQHKKELATLAALEMGKPIAQGKAEVEKCAWTAEYYADHAQQMLADEVVKSNASKSYIHFEPLGAVLAIMPWNFPYWQVLRFAVPALMAGNVGLLKHAPSVPQAAKMLERLFRRAGFPAGAFQNLFIDIPQTADIIADDRVQAVTLTGSVGAGSVVAALAGKAIKKTVLELGGSDPFIVLPDADIKMACTYGVTARLQNAGQSCIAAKRFIVVRSVAKKFLDMYKAQYETVTLGDPLDPHTEIGPLATEDVYNSVAKQVRQSVRKGARVLTGGKRYGRLGYFFRPTILTNVKPGMPAYDEEIFGPVASVIVVKDAEDAIRVANDTSFGLGASIWTRNVKRAQKLAEEIQAGNVFINGIVKSDPRLPFGGVKESGYGRELSHYGIKEFVNIKTIWVK